MPRSPYPPQDFECLYKDSCPYLDGLSTTWVLGEYRRAEDEYQEHLRILDNLYDDLKARDDRIRVLERENAQLKAKLQALHQRQFKPNQKKDAQTGGMGKGPHRPGKGRRKNAGRRWDIRDGCGPSPTVLIGPFMRLLRRSAPIVNPTT